WKASIACASSTHSTVSDSTVSVAQECTRNGGWWRPQLGAMRNAIETIITAETAAHLCRDSDTGALSSQMGRSTYKVVVEAGLWRRTCDSSDQTVWHARWVNTGPSGPTTSHSLGS